MCEEPRIDIIGIYKTPEGGGVWATIAIGFHKPDGEGTGNDDDAKKALRKVFNDNEAQELYLTRLEAADLWGIPVGHLSGNFDRSVSADACAE